MATVSSGIDTKIATKVLNTSGNDLKKIDLTYLAEKMSEKEIITNDQRRNIVGDRMIGEGGQMDKLLNILKDTVAVNGSIFTWFIQILEGHNVVSQGIAQGLQKKYEELLLMESTKKKPCTTQKPQGEHGVEDTDSPTNSAGPAAPEVPAEHFPVLKYIQTEYKPFSEDLVQDITVLLMTATEIELRGIMGYLKSMGDTENDKIIETFTNAEAGKIKFYIGKYGQYPVVVGMSAPGKAQQGPLDANDVTTKLMNTVKPRYVIAVGICYGMDKSKTSSGDVIVANLICDYTCLRVGDKDTLQPRGGIPPVGATLLQVFSSPVGYSHTQDGKKVEVRCGPFIARPDLVDSPKYKEELKRLKPDALGGEMEGAGIMAAVKNDTSKYKVEAIIIKAICDWGDGEKSKAADWKPFSSHAAARYVHHQMNKYPDIFIGNDAPEATTTTISPVPVPKQDASKADDVVDYDNPATKGNEKGTGMSSSMKQDGPGNETDLTNVKLILTVLKKAMFGPANWEDLGLSLGLYPPTLEVIGKTNGDANDYLRLTIKKWTEKQDGVKGVTWPILIDAVRSTGNNAAADRMPDIIKIEEKKL